MRDAIRYFNESEMDDEAIDSIISRVVALDNVVMGRTQFYPANANRATHSKNGPQPSGYMPTAAPVHPFVAATIA